ncbi:MAG: PEP-CTERM sorting domain-containing protein [Thiobacillus sp.]|nr:PEP-CTERM sorting domain-containing protein [Thiobacillus sp.]
MPQGTLPASTPDTLTPPLAGEPFGPLTPPSDKEVTAQPNAVPEPSMIALMLLGLAGLAWAGRRRANPLRLA